jgi:hypothetical protein
MTPIRQAAPMGRPYRVSSDSAWPVRGADGRTFAERAALRSKQQEPSQCR